MIVFFAVAIYAAAIISANLLVLHFGPWISPFNSFFLIGLDLALRDFLHMRLRPWQMGVLILSTGIATYALNPAAGMIAVASAAAFSAAAVTDWVTFSKLSGTWLYRSNGSNVAGAAVDSVLFPTIAFGVMMPHIVALQFVAKVSGGLIWSMIINALFFRRRQ
jgi:queuosine precursor transporter